MAGTLTKRVLGLWCNGFVKQQPIPLTCMKRWLLGESLESKQLRQEFGKDVLEFRRQLTSVEGGNYTDLAADAQGALAVTILGDSLTRAMLPNSPQAYEAEKEVRALAWLSIGGHEDELDHVERSWLYLPLLHNEELTSVSSGLSKARENLRDAPRVYRPYLTQFVKYAEEHMGVLDRFKRFPLRNAVLGRQSTPEEVAYLNSLGVVGGPVNSNPDYALGKFRSLSKRALQQALDEAAQALPPEARQEWEKIKAGLHDDQNMPSDEEMESPANVMRKVLDDREKKGS